MQDEGALLVRQDLVVDRRLGGVEPIAGHDRAGLVALALADHRGPHAVVQDAEALADVHLAEHVEAPGVQDVLELVLVLQTGEHVQRRRVVGEPFRDPLVAVVLPVDEGAPPLVRHLVGAEYLRHPGVELAERLVRQQHHSGERLAVVGHGFGQQQRGIRIGAEVVPEHAYRSLEVLDGLAQRARCEPGLAAVLVDADRGQALGLGRGDLEAADAERHAAHRRIRDPFGYPRVVDHALVEQLHAAGDLQALRGAEAEALPPAPVVGVRRRPVQRVLQEVSAGGAQTLDERAFVGDFEYEPLARGHGAGQGDRHPLLVQVVAHEPPVRFLHVRDRIAGGRGRLRRIGRRVAAAGLFRAADEGHGAHVLRVLRPASLPVHARDLQQARDLQPQRGQRLQRLDEQRGGAGGVAVALQGEVDVGARNREPRRPPLVRGEQRAGGQAEVARVPVVVVLVVAAAGCGSVRLGITGKPAERTLGRAAVELLQRVEPHPDVAHVAPVVVAEDGHFLPRPRLDLYREPALVVPVDLCVEVRRPARGRRRGFGRQDVEQQPAVGVVELVLQQRLAAVVEQVVGPSGAPSARSGCQRAQAPARVAGQPEHEAVELLFQQVLVEELLHLLVLHPVRRPGAHDAVAQVDGHVARRAPVRQHVQVAAGQLELEAVDAQHAAVDAAGRLKRGVYERLVGGGRFWFLAIAAVLAGR